MKNYSFARPLAALTLALMLGVGALADTIRMKDGQVIRGQIVGFRDQQFTVLIGSGSRGGRRSRITLYMEDVESIEFDSAGGGETGAAEPSGEPAPTRPSPSDTGRAQTPSTRQPGGPPTLGSGSDTSRTPTQPRDNGVDTSAPSGTQTASRAGDSPFFPVRVRVRADNQANGWTDSGLMVRKGQRLRISATGRISLGQGRFSTPTGLPRVMDTEKLMRNEPTGTLIAVIGDDNDEFIAVGSNREFFAPRDGRLFLGVNEGNLADNTGNYDVVIEVEPVAGGGN